MLSHSNLYDVTVSPIPRLMHFSASMDGVNFTRVKGTGNPNSAASLIALLPAPEHAAECVKRTIEILSP